MAQIRSKGTPDSTKTEGENPYELTLRLLARQKVGILKSIMEKNGEKLMVSESAIADYLSSADSDLPDVGLYLVHNRHLRHFLNIQESLTISDSVTHSEDEIIDDFYLEAEFEAIARNKVAGIRAFYLTRELLSDERATGIVTFIADILMGVIRKAGECGFQLPAPWTKPFGRGSITRLFFEGHKQHTSDEATLKKREAEALADGSPRYGTSSEIMADFDRIESEDLRELTTKYPTPVDFAMKYLDFQTMLRLKLIQSNPL